MRDLVIDPQTGPSPLTDAHMTATPIDQPTDAFCELFRVAFELTADEDRSYRTAFLHSRPPADVQTSHVVVALDGDPVAIASLHRTPSTSFLYNVGTRPDCRGLGCATRAVTELLSANQTGPDTVWLQCIADSREEDLYHQLGFKTLFEASTVAMP